MSVFGGDSWAREAGHRKRRVDDLLIQGVNGSYYKKLSSGKFACLVCPHNPILDSPLMLSMHSKGSRHIAAESRMKERELMKQDEINKRLALLDSSFGSSNSSTSNKKVRLGSKPLIEQTQKAVSETLCKKTPQQGFRSQILDDGKLRKEHTTSVMNNLSENRAYPGIQAFEKPLAENKMGMDFQERRERELKFTEAGWKRDCHGRWFRDENVEFDSDEEDPNICLAQNL